MAGADPDGDVGHAGGPAAEHGAVEDEEGGDGGAEPGDATGGGTRAPADRTRAATGFRARDSTGGVDTGEPHRGGAEGGEEHTTSGTRTSTVTGPRLSAPLHTPARAA